MAFVNNFTPAPPPAPMDDPYGPDPYDINWPCPLHPQTLENDVVKLTPLIPRIHADTFWAQLQPVVHTTVRWMPSSLQTFEEYLASLENSRAGSDGIMFAVVDKTRPSELGLSGALAGQIALWHTSIPNRSTMISSIITLPHYQRTHVTSNAIGLLLKYCLNSPKDTLAPGLGLRRVEWRASVRNVPSITTAKRMGFTEEGTLRWFRVLPEGKEGHDPHSEDECRRKGLFTVFLSICWDDWLSGGRETAEKQMQRRS